MQPAPLFTTPRKQSLIPVSFLDNISDYVEFLTIVVDGLDLHNSFWKSVKIDHTLYVIAGQFP